MKSRVYSIATLFLAGFGLMGCPEAAGNRGEACAPGNSERCRQVFVPSAAVAQRIADAQAAAAAARQQSAPAQPAASNY